MIRVLVCDDFPVVREGLKDVLSTCGFNVADIADKLSLTMKMVNGDRTLAFEKNELATNVEFFRYATKHRLIGS